MEEGRTNANKPLLVAPSAYDLANCIGRNDKMFGLILGSGSNKEEEGKENCLTVNALGEKFLHVQVHIIMWQKV